ncbi:MAG: hypothetical protein JSU87_07795 [Gemmatimonadota bacterium]|nr:MAG: hypothetical protein JSU87_07795 [Gemmatimonadota bacterium]
MRPTAAWLLAASLAATPVCAQTQLVVITGLSGEPRYAEEFHAWATTLLEAALNRWGLAESSVHYLAEATERDPERIVARSTRENIEEILRALAERVGPDEQIFIILIGHGTVRGEEARVNLPGPDMTAANFAALLEAFPTQKIVFVNAASASGGFIEALSAGNRTVITATRSASERNRTLFGRYFVEAFAGAGADVDKDDRVSALEAFSYAKREVARAYEAEGRLLTEHALLDDNGDGEGSDEPQGDPDGSLARSVFMVGGLGAAAGREQPADPRLAELYRDREELERQVAALRARKNEMDPEAYERQLEATLIEIALKTRAIREVEEGVR